MSGQFAQQIPSGLSPFAAPGVGTFFGPFQPQASANNPFGLYASIQSGPYGPAFAQQPLQQIVQSLVAVPQQLQHLLQLAQIQQQQVQYLLQSIPQQIQQLQQQLLQQPGLLQSFAPLGFSHPSLTQPGHVM